MSWEPGELLVIEVHPKRKSIWLAIGDALLITVVTTVVMFPLIAAEDPAAKRSPDVLWLIGFSLAFGSVLGVAWFFFARQLSRLHRLLLTDAALAWEETTGNRGEIRLVDLAEAQLERRRTLVLRSVEGPALSIPLDWFREPQQGERLLREMGLRLSRLPGGAATLERVTSVWKRAGEAASLKPYATWSLLAVLALAFLAQWALGALSDPIALLELGANSAPLVAAGEIYRLATGNLLHGGWLHLFLNGNVLWVVGGRLERFFGPARLLVIFFIAALAGCWGSAFVGHHALAVGASAGIMGLIAAEVVFLRRYREVFKQPSMRSWLLFAALLVLPGLILPAIDNWAHAFGFAAGLGLMAATSKDVDVLALRRHRSGVMRAAAALLTALFVAAALPVVSKVGSPRGDLDTAVSLLRAEKADPELIDIAAYAVARHPATRAAELHLALARLEKVEAESPSRAQIVELLRSRLR